MNERYERFHSKTGREQEHLFGSSPFCSFLRRHVPNSSMRSAWEAGDWSVSARRPLGRAFGWGSSCWCEDTFLVWSMSSIRDANGAAATAAAGPFAAHSSSCSSGRRGGVFIVRVDNNQPACDFVALPSSAFSSKSCAVG